MADLVAESQYKTLLKKVYKDRFVSPEEKQMLEDYIRKNDMTREEADKLEREFVESLPADEEYYEPQAMQSKVRSENIYDNIAELAMLALEGDIFPFLSFPPSPMNLNLISGESLNTIQTIQLELLDELSGRNGQAWGNKWIYGADASEAGLELKKDSDFEVELYANFESKDGRKNLDSQKAYSLNQFTDESILRTLTSNSRLGNQIKANISDNNVSQELKEFRKLCQKNVSDNMNKHRDAIAEEFNLISGNVFGGISPQEKACFYTVYKYFMNQQGIDADIPCELANKDTFKNVLNFGGKERFAKLMFCAMSHAEHLMHYDFTYNPVYSPVQALGEGLNKFRRNSNEGFKNLVHPELRIQKNMEQNASKTRDKGRTSPTHNHHQSR